MILLPTINSVNYNRINYYNSRNKSLDYTNIDFGSQSNSNRKKVYQVYIKTNDMLYSGGNGTGLSFIIKYAERSTEDNPMVVAEGVDESGNVFKQIISIKDIDPSNATIVEMRALEAYYNADKGKGLSSLPNEAGSMGLHDKSNFLDMFERKIQDMKTLGKYDLSMFYIKNLRTYLEHKVDIVI